MDIKLKAVAISQPGVLGGGTKKYVARAISDGEVGLTELIASIEKMSTFSGADVSGLVYALVDVAIDMLREGKIVRIEGLGSLRVSVKSRAEDSPEKVNEKSVKGAKLVLTPDSRFKKMLKALCFKMVKW